MKKITILLLVLLSNILYAKYVQAQTWTAGDNVTLQISAFGLIDSNHAPVSMTMASPTAGEAVVSTSNSDLFIKISSIVPGGTDREITARISNGTVPSGTILELQAASCTAANSGGELGIVETTPIVLSTADQYLVRFIQTCYTGTGYNDGYQMTFTWSPVVTSSTYGQIEAITASITVVFTLTAHDGN
jgi:hypothetical protein